LSKENVGASTSQNPRIAFSTIGTGTLDLLACGRVPQPTACPVREGIISYEFPLSRKLCIFLFN
jgi:hypothetical protein